MTWWVAITLQSIPGAGQKHGPAAAPPRGQAEGAHPGKRRAVLRDGVHGENFTWASGPCDELYFVMEFMRELHTGLMRLVLESELACHDSASFHNPVRLAQQHAMQRNLHTTTWPSQQCWTPIPSS